MLKTFFFKVFALSSLGDHIYFRTDVTSDELVGRTWKVVHMSRPLISCSEATSLDTVSSEGISSAENNESKIIRLELLIICCPKTKTLVFTNSLMADSL